MEASLLLRQVHHHRSRSPRLTRRVVSSEIQKCRVNSFALGGLSACARTACFVYFFGDRPLHGQKGIFGARAAVGAVNPTVHILEWRAIVLRFCSTVVFVCKVRPRPGYKINFSV